MFTRSFNLQDMCLVAIVRDIDLFVYNKTVPQKHIEFLFRAYSDEVFSKHKTLKKSIDEDCMMWFLNPHVKKVTLPGPFHSERVIQQLKLIGSGISSLNLHKSKASENELNSIICCVPHVVHLDLSDTSCSDETLECIRKSCQELESLNVSSCYELTDRGLENLCGSKLPLKYLNICCGLEADGIAIILNRMPSLECVKCDGELVSLLCKIGISKTYNLTEVMYDETFSDDPVKSIKAIAKMCPKLKKLHFVHPVPEKVLKECPNFKNLEELKIKMSHEYYNLVNVDDVLTPILKNLKTLILSCVEISALTLIESFKNLENLYLKKVSFSSFKKNDVKVTTTNLITLVMKDIDMEVNSATYEAIALLISFSKNVTKLHLNNIKHLPSEMFDLISQSMRNLTLVNFEHTCVKMHYLNQLFEIPSLVTLKANWYENQEDYSAQNLFPKSASCTLSWRCMYDSDEDTEDEDHTFDDGDDDCNDKYYYDCDGDDHESDIISDKCNSTDSESDDRFYHRNRQFWDDDDEYF